MHKSIATIDSLEFIDLKPLEVNPLMSLANVKVLYIGQNRNMSYITKEVATEMSKTLRGAPVVGYWKEDKQDFGDHGHQMVWDDEGIHFNCLTIPYGFVAPDAKVWFQKFDDEDDFGNTVTREYLMTQCYLWTGQFEAAAAALKNGGKPQSMELDEESLDGHWSTDSKSGLDFFIINDATFSKLCILGDDVEPCFEGASVTPATYSLDNGFKNTLFSMIEDLKKYAIGGNQIMNENEQEVTLETEEAIEAPVVETEPEFTAQSEEVEAAVEVEAEVEADADFAEKKDEDEDEEDAEEQSEEDTESDDESEEEPAKEEDEEDDTKKKYELLQEQYNALEVEFAALTAKYKEALAFKTQIENEQKDALIKEFYMLSDSDKYEVVKNKEKYSYDEIKGRLAALCFDKKLGFSVDTEEEATVTEPTSQVITYNIEENTESIVPAFVQALRNTRKNKCD